MHIADPVMMPTLPTLFAWCTGVWFGLQVHVRGQIQKDFKYLAKRPAAAAGSEFFRIRIQIQGSVAMEVIGKYHHNTDTRISGHGGYR